MKTQSKSNTDAPLIPFSDFQAIAAKVLSVSKEESDKQLEKFQASNPKGKAQKQQSKTAPK
ncbi:MAG: hypothetical protein JWN98_80 [Abditibacteriota bacterium]|nr:hypothetical protein [Abditibacteriota bacterium]